LQASLPCPSLWSDLTTTDTLPVTSAMPPTASAFIAILPDLRRTARSLSRSNEDADDLVQEALLRVWARLAMDQAGTSDASPVTDLRAYAFATLRNCARSRSSLTVSAEELADPPARDSSPETQLACREALLAIDGLPPEQRLMLRLRAIEGLSYSEIVSQTGLPLGTVTSRLARGRKALRRTLGLPEGAALTDLLTPAPKR